MGLFDRFRSTTRTSDSGAGEADAAAEENARNLIGQGNAHEDAGQWQEALHCYDAALRLAPKLASAYLNRGNALLAMDDANGALEAYLSALGIVPDYAAAHYNAGNAQLRLGMRETALDFYRTAIRLKPEFADAYVASGNVHEDLGQLEEAVASYTHALRVRPEYAEVHCNLGSVLTQLGRADAAAAAFRRAIAIKPDMVAAHFALAQVLRTLHRPDEALTCYERLLDVVPDNAEAHLYHGDLLNELGRADEAVASYRRAVAIRPDFVAAHNNLGNVLKNLGRRDEAVASYRRALAGSPGDARVLNNLGGVLIDIGRDEDAEATLRRAVAIDPGLEQAHNNLGNAQYAQGKLHDAAESFRHALAIDPRSADTHCNLGYALYGLGRLYDALASFRRAIELNPNHADAHHSVGNTMKDLGQLDAAVESYARALDIDPGRALTQGSLLYTRNYERRDNAPALLAEARRFGEIAASIAPAFKSWDNEPDPRRRLRVGLVSGDFRKHAAGYFADAAVAALTAQPAAEIHLVGYYNHFVVDAVTRRIKAACRDWRQTRALSDDDLVRKIREDRIDILIDLSGHTADNRLLVFARKPAPVQASWLGYFATTGLEAIDYFVADPWTLPPEEEENFTERIWRLPETRLCFTPPEDKVEVGPLPAIAAGHVSFGCFNNLTKMNDDVVALWAQVLGAVPRSRLFLMASQLAEASVCAAVRERFARRGVDSGRLVLQGPMPRAAYLAAYGKVDIALDPFPFPGGATSVEALWMGVPVLTLAGRRFISRQGVGLLMNAGLSDWVAADPDDYVARAVAQCGDLQRLAELRRSLRPQVLASPAFDAPRFARHFALALRGMWEAWCAGRQ